MWTRLRLLEFGGPLLGAALFYVLFLVGPQHHQGAFAVGAFLLLGALPFAVVRPFAERIMPNHFRPDGMFAIFYFVMIGGALLFATSPWTGALQWLASHS